MPDSAAAPTAAWATLMMTSRSVTTFSDATGHLILSVMQCDCRARDRARWCRPSYAAPRR
jgi:hypothetical protein